MTTQNRNFSWKFASSTAQIKWQFFDMAIYTTYDPRQKFYLANMAVENCLIAAIRSSIKSRSLNICLFDPHGNNSARFFSRKLQNLHNLAIELLFLTVFDNLFIISLYVWHYYFFWKFNSSDSETTIPSSENNIPSRKKAGIFIVKLRGSSS